MDRRPIALIGLMGAGKSAVARLLGERLGASMADLDAMVEAAEGRADPREPGEETESSEGLLKLTAKADPVLAEIWDNDKDAAYDRL